MTTMPAYAPLYAPLSADEFEAHDADGYSRRRHLSHDDRKTFMRRAVETSEAATPVVRHSRELLHAMGAYPETALTHHRISMLLQLMSKLTTATSVFPILAPDGHGGINFEWIAAPRHLTLELPAEGVYTFSEVDEHGELTAFREGPVKRLPMGFIASRIEEFSNYVNEANPDWRSSF